MQRLASLLAKGSTEGLKDKVLLSGLSAQETTRKVAAAAAGATKPSIAHSRRIEHGSNSLLNTLSTFTSHYPFYSPTLPVQGGRTSAKRQVEHGSSSLLRVLTGHMGTPRKGPHPNTLLYHATARGGKHKTQTSPSSARKAAVARGRAIEGLAGEQLQKGVEKKVSSWFWPFDQMF